MSKEYDTLYITSRSFLCSKTTPLFWSSHSRGIIPTGGNPTVHSYLWLGRNFHLVVEKKRWTKVYGSPIC